MDARTFDLKQRRLADALATIDAATHSGELAPDAYRLAFTDPEFMLRPETRGIRFQLEMLKPDLAQIAAGVAHTIVVFGSARFAAPQDAAHALAAAQASGDAQALALAQRDVRNARYYAQAREFARLVSQDNLGLPSTQRLYICTGGGPGIMEAATRGAYDVGAPSVALNITLPHEQSANAYVSPHLSFKFHYFAARKMHFMMRAKALVAFPGGFGTLDELFEVVTLVQTRKVQPVPILLFGSDYWHRLLNFDFLVNEGMIAREDLQLVQFVDEPQAAWNAIRHFYKL